jgi:hypothetical protein
LIEGLKEFERTLFLLSRFAADHAPAEIWQDYQSL